MVVKQEAILEQHHFPMVAWGVHTFFYIDDGLTGASLISEAVNLQKQLQELFEGGGFLLCQWGSNEAAALNHLLADLVYHQTQLEIPVTKKFAKVLEIEWSRELVSFRLTSGTFPSTRSITKRVLSSTLPRYLMFWDGSLLQL